MNTLARIASTLLAASIVAASFTAMAGEPPAEARSVDHKTGRAHHEKASFPMKADEFRKLVDKRTERIKARVERAMSKHEIPAAQRAEVNKAVEGAVKEIHAAVDKVAADGMVTKDEAKQIKELAEQLRDKVREQVKGKSPRAKAQKANKPKKAA